MDLQGPAQLTAGAGPALRRGEKLGLLRLELGVGENALRLQLSELLQLRDEVGRFRCGCRGRRRGVVLLLLRRLLVLLFGPAVGLATRHTVRDGGSGTGDDRRASDPSD